MSTTALNTTFSQIRLAGGITQTFGDASVPYSLDDTWNLQFTDGTGANQFNKVASVIDTTSTSYSVVTGSVSDIDFTSIAGPFSTVTFTAMKLISIFNQSVTVGQNIIVGSAASNPFTNAFTGTLIIPPGGMVSLVCPTAAGWVVDSTHKMFRLRSATGSPAYTLRLGGI